MLSHRGRVRHSNQDACAALADVGAFVVCDGMGGAAGGEIASRLATEAFLNYLAQPASTSSDSAMRVRLAEAVQAANEAVFRYSRKSPSLYGMGTTLVALLWEEAPADSKAWIAHVGDSRCYRLRSGKLELLTRDHSLVEEQVRAGVLSRVQATISPMRNIITRAIGTQPTVEPEIAGCKAQSGDLYLLASDGLSREVNEGDLEQILTSEASRATLAADCSPAKTGHRVQAVLDSTCLALVDAANANGGSDNITVLLVACA
jgi:protein phosphatase